MKLLSTPRQRRRIHQSSAVNAYIDDRLVHRYGSISHAARYIGVSPATISRHIAMQTPFLGVMYYKARQDPHNEKNPRTSACNQRIVAFDRETDQYVVTYRDVPQLAEALHRTQQTVLDWLNGAKEQSDPDFYFVWERDCEEGEIPTT